MEIDFKFESHSLINEIDPSVYRAFSVTINVTPSASDEAEWDFVAIFCPELKAEVQFEDLPMEDRKALNEMAERMASEFADEVYEDVLSTEADAANEEREHGE